jgi:hypothetical protein
VILVAVLILQRGLAGLRLSGLVPARNLRR